MPVNRLDIIVAELWWGDKCGHTALAAVLDCSMSEARRLMRETKEERVHSMWKGALSQAGRRWLDIGTDCPQPGTYGLVWLVFSNNCAHAIAVQNDGSRILAFDNHSARWLKLKTWESIVMPIHHVMTFSRKCWIHNVIEVEKR